MIVKSILELAIYIYSNLPSIFCKSQSYKVRFYDAVSHNGKATWTEPGQPWNCNMHLFCTGRQELRDRIALRCCALSSELASLGSNLDPAINHHTGVSYSVHRWDVKPEDKSVFTGRWWMLKFQQCLTWWVSLSPEPWINYKSLL